MNNYYTTRWQDDNRIQKTSIFKRGIYYFSRPFLSVYTSRYLSPETLNNLRPSLVLPGRGMPLETRRLWGSSLCNIREATVLVQGTGTGWDVISWARLKPKRIIATDLFEFKESWNDITTFCKDFFGVTVEFFQAPLENHSFLTDESIDLCASDNVLEHCQNLKAVLKESFRILKPGGTLYAAYNPLYFCAGGDHFSGRGGLKNAFNHILLSPEEYKQYFDSFCHENEDFQSGGRYVKMNLFSKLTTKEYCHLYQSTGFLINNLIIGISPTSLAFKVQFPDCFNKLILKYKNICLVDDFLINLNLVRLIKEPKKV